MKIVRIVALGCALFYGAGSSGMEQAGDPEQNYFNAHFPRPENAREENVDEQEDSVMTRMHACRLLKLDPTVEFNKDAVIKAFRSLSKELHPDKHVMDSAELRERAKKMYAQVQRARDFLINPLPANVVEAPQGESFDVSAAELLNHDNIEGLRQRLVGHDNIRLVIDFSADLTGSEKAQAMQDLYGMIANASGDTRVKSDQLSEYITSIEVSEESFAIDTIENTATSIENFSKIIDRCEYAKRQTFTNKSNIYNQHIEEIERIFVRTSGFSGIVLGPKARIICADRLKFYASNIRINAVSAKSICGKAVIAGVASLVPYIVSTVAVVAINGYLLKHCPKFYNNFFYSAHTTYGNLRTGMAISFLTGFGWHVGKSFGKKLANKGIYMLPDDQFQNSVNMFEKAGFKLPMNLPTTKEIIFGGSVKKAPLNLLLNL
jgi:hypothetical protein